MASTILKKNKVQPKLPNPPQKMASTFDFDMYFATGKNPSDHILDFGQWQVAC